MIFIVASILIIKCKTVKKFVAYSTIMLIPIVITIGINNIICLVNHEYYGVYKRINYSNDCIKLMKAIDSEEKTDTISIPMSKMEKLCEISSSLGEYKKEIMFCMEAYGKLDDCPEDGEVSNGYFPWAIRDALSSAGVYESATKADEYYEKVYLELSEAVQSGELVLSNKISNTLLQSLPNKVIQAFKVIMCFDDLEINIDSKSAYSTDKIDQIYKEISLGKIIYSEEDIEKYGIVSLDEQNEYLEKYKFLENIYERNYKNI